MLRLASQSSLSNIACVKHNPTETDDGDSSVKQKPGIHRLQTSIANVIYSRLMGFLYTSSTIIISTGV